MMKLLIILGLSLNPLMAMDADAGGGGSGGVDTTPLTDPAPQMLPPVTDYTQECTAAVTKVNESATTANAAVKTAGSWCLAQSSPKIHMGIVAVGGLLAGISVLKNMGEACSKYSDAMKAGQMAMTAYTTSCSVVQIRCDSAIAAYKADLKVVGRSCATYADVMSQVTSEEATAEKYASTCNGYKTSMLVAGAGIMSMLQQSGLMGKCEKAVAAVDCVKDPTNAQCPQAVDCTNAANAANATCICKATPTAIGCPGAVAGNSPGAGAPSGNGGKPADGAGHISAGSYVSDGTSDGIISPTGSSAAGVSGSSLAGSGAGGGGGGPGGGTGGAKKEEAGKKTGLNANILGGYDGGGGGGGSRGGGSGSNSGLNAYLPGGAKDPRRNLASQNALNSQVTAAGSKSNWEKVSDRYKDNSRTLMGP